MLDNVTASCASKYEKVKMKELAVTEDVEKYLLGCVADAAAQQNGSSIQPCITLSLALGAIEESLTRKKDPVCLDLAHLQVRRCISLVVHPH